MWRESKVATSHYTRVRHVGSGRVQHMSNCTRAYNTTKHMYIIQLYTCVLYNYTRVGRITDTWIMDESTTAVCTIPTHVYTAHSTRVYCTLYMCMLYSAHSTRVYRTIHLSFTMFTLLCTIHVWWDTSPALTRGHMGTRRKSLVQSSHLHTCEDVTCHICNWHPNRHICNIELYKTS